MATLKSNATQASTLEADERHHFCLNDEVYKELGYHLFYAFVEADDRFTPMTIAFYEDLKTRLGWNFWIYGTYDSTYDMVIRLRTPPSVTAGDVDKAIKSTQQRVSGNALERKIIPIGDNFHWGNRHNGSGNISTGAGEDEIKQAANFIERRQSTIDVSDDVTAEWFTDLDSKLNAVFASEARANHDDRLENIPAELRPCMVPLRLESGCMKFISLVKLRTTSISMLKDAFTEAVVKSLDATREPHQHPVLTRQSLGVGWDGVYVLSAQIDSAELPNFYSTVIQTHIEDHLPSEIVRFKTNTLFLIHPLPIVCYEAFQVSEIDEDRRSPVTRETVVDALNTGESHTVEVKASSLVDYNQTLKSEGLVIDGEGALFKAIARSCCAMFNTDGGLILIGAIERERFFDTTLRWSIDDRFEQIPSTPFAWGASGLIRLLPAADIEEERIFGGFELVGVAADLLALRSREKIRVDRHKINLMEEEDPRHGELWNTMLDQYLVRLQSKLLQELDIGPEMLRIGTVEISGTHVMWIEVSVQKTLRAIDRDWFYIGGRFYVRSGASNKELVGPKADQYKRDWVRRAD